MASSLERSLELAAIHSDGLSDKERSVRAVKYAISDIYRQKNSTKLPELTCETSTSEDDLDTKRVQC
jgi:hypothetical protein